MTVVDSQNRYVTDLTEDDFTIYEDGARQDLILFNRTSLPIAMSLLIDTSASMESRMATAQDAATGFARTLRSQDLAQVVDFDSRVEILQDFTNDVAELERAIRSTSAGGSTSLNNALYISLKELAKVKAKTADDVRRQAIIVLSDGEDTSSLVTYDEVLDLAKRSETAIYTIGVRGGGKSRVTEGSDPSYSPDGSQIVFESDRGGSQQLRGGVVGRLAVGCRCAARSGRRRRLGSGGWRDQ